MMPFRVILTITEKKITTPGPLTWGEATALARHHNDEQLNPAWKYSIEHYKEDEEKEGS
ncbi:MAG: hypothetical protein KAX31_04460 [Thermoplasmata archaeon]|nr:hypothetical protein [Thermoplasmata archaeon]